jgi:hypothetical protein
MATETVNRVGDGANEYKRSYSTAVRNCAIQLTVEPHIYNALDPASKDIHFLEVAPGTGNDIITCTLKHVSLLSIPAPVYETILYCWGPPNDP